MESLLPSFSIFLLIFTRVSAFFVTMPLFSYKTVPASLRIGLAFFLAWAMCYSIHVRPFNIDGLYVLLILKEAAVGLLIGFAAYIMISAIQIAGGLIDFQMGYTIANVIDPQTGAQSPITGQYLYLFSLLLLLTTNGHYMILDGIYYSYQFIPIDHMVPFTNATIMVYIVRIFANMFVIAFQMSIPVVASLFLVDVALGIVARTVPQMNIFVIGFPIKMIVSYIILITVMGGIFVVVEHLFESTFQMMRQLMEMMGEKP
ncbi:flagellar biosynthetic protein FliR [Heyndrickxia acidicola]|uniref:Flagellar biosynthetic protein FliR n=1 Tax=Heyndrickxia acidicola TaxID=209389 RepID=A0ABU6MC99_9BACI|nr:flagellar biosynthetic protein FliR [Heyndrickxia acidicola]MED1202059.1 flagellar biosynthetic protein FliR [Heyndrickxia acidicola]